MNKQIVSNTVTMGRTRNSKKLFPLHLRKQPEKDTLLDKSPQKISIIIIHISNMRISALSGKALPAVSQTDGENLLLLRCLKPLILIMACVH